MSGAICESYAVEAGAFGTAGEASGKVKGSTLFPVKLTLIIRGRGCCICCR